MSKLSDHAIIALARIAQDDSSIHACAGTWATAECDCIRTYAAAVVRGGDAIELKGQPFDRRPTVNFDEHTVGCGARVHLDGSRCNCKKGGSLLPNALEERP